MKTLKSLSKIILALTIVFSFTTIITSMSTHTAEASTTKYYMVNKTLYLKQLPRSSSKNVVKIWNGRSVTFISKSGSWSKVKYGSKVGYIQSKQLVLAPSKVTWANGKTTMSITVDHLDEFKIPSFKTYPASTKNAIKLVCWGGDNAVEYNKQTNTLKAIATTHNKYSYLSESDQRTTIVFGVYNAKTNTYLNQLPSNTLRLYVTVKDSKDPIYKPYRLSATKEHLDVKGIQAELQKYCEDIGFRWDTTLTKHNAGYPMTMDSRIDYRSAEQFRNSILFKIDEVLYKRGAKSAIDQVNEDSQYEEYRPRIYVYFEKYKGSEGLIGAVYGNWDTDYYYRVYVLEK